jgi:hypothetical protein
VIYCKILSFLIFNVKFDVLIARCYFMENMKNAKNVFGSISFIWGICLQDYCLCYIDCEMLFYEKHEECKGCL